jgi:hypothetical protein
MQKSGDGDELVPDRKVREELGGISQMALWRWSRDPKLKFPPVVNIRGRNFRSRKMFEEFKLRQIRESVKRRA